MTQDCKVCLAPHDEEIHAATDRVLRWFRAQVTKHLPSVAASCRPARLDMRFEGNLPDGHFPAS